jgi:hypothetical protein
MRTASHCALKVKCARCGVACGGDCGMWLGRGDIGSNTPFRLPSWLVGERAPTGDSEYFWVPGQYM